MLLAICAVIVFLAAAIVWMPMMSANDPVYRGRRLSGWLKVYPHTPPQPMERPPRAVQPMSSEEIELFYDRKFGNDVAEAHRALLSVGGDALPLLVQMLGEPEKKLERWRSQLRSVIARYVPIGPSGYHVSREQAITALLDLNRARCDLGPVIPEIEKLANHSDSEISNAARFLMDSLTREGTIPGTVESAK